MPPQPDQAPASADPKSHRGSSPPSRDLQLSLIEGEERPVGPLPLSVQTGTNADLMARLAPLYLTGSVLDVTYGRGMRWRQFTPQPFTSHDLALDGVDFRALPHRDGSFDAVCFDPPYVPAGGVRQKGGGQTKDEADFRDRFGLAPRSLAALNDLIAAGLAECSRVASSWVLVKCSDFVTGGSFTLGHLTVLDRARELDMKVHDLIVHFSGTGPGGHNITTVKRTRRAHSYLIVLVP